MPDPIPLTGEGWESVIDGTSALVSGMTYQQGVSAMNNVVPLASTNGSNNILTFPVQQTTEYTTTMQAVYAETLWETAKVLGPAGLVTTSLGAAAAGVKEFGTAVFIGDTSAAGSLAGTGALMTMSLPAAVAAAAPLCGVSIGASLYNLNPELWTKISQALLPWCYDDSWTVGMVVNELGQCFLPKGIVDALKGVFDAENIGPSNTVEINNWDFAYGNSFVTFSLTGGHTAVYEYSLISGGPFITAVSTGTIFYQIVVYGQSTSNITTKVQEKYYYDGSLQSTRVVDLTWWGNGSNTGYLSNAPGWGLSSEVSGVPVLPIDNNTLVNYFSSNIVNWGQTPAGYYPDGTSAWEGTSVDLNSTPTIDVLIQDAGGIGTSPYYPVTPNIGDPITSPSPLEVPNPTQFPLEWPEIAPLAVPQPAPEQWPDEWAEEAPQPDPEQEISPVPDPLYIPTPDVNPNLNPSLDPALNPDIVPAPESVPEPESAPQSAGDTPPIIFPVPDIPFPSAVPASGSGLIHVYNPTASEFTSFGNWLWVTYADPSIDKLWNNPFDGVISAHELYATPSHDGTDTIKSGFLDSGISSTIVRQRYTSINCGSMIIPEYYGNYLDYSPYSKAFIYLPFIGIVEVDVDDIVGHSINILYHVDSYNGSCIAQVTVAKDDYTNTVYQFSGNCAVDVPLAGGSQSAIRAAMISASAYGIGSTIQGIIGGGATGGLGGATVGGVSNAIGGIASGIANVVSQKSSVQHSGSFGASYGAMGIKKPYIIIRRPVQKQVMRYNDDYGYPAHKRVTIGTCTGFLRVREVNVVSTLATNEEKIQIENWLKAGVYID